jgi:hypothetical protein
MQVDAQIEGLRAQVPSAEPELPERLEALKRLRDLFAHELDSARDHAGGTRAAANRRARTISEQIEQLLEYSRRPKSGAQGRY